MGRRGTRRTEERMEGGRLGRKRGMPPASSRSKGPTVTGFLDLWLVY